MLPRNANLEDVGKPWENDWLGYKEQADTLKKLLARQEGPLVISISAPFGMGKTFFAKNFLEDLKQEGAKTIYFNAWEEDIFNTPLLSLIKAIKNEFGKKEGAALKKLVSVAAKILIGASKGFLDATTFGLRDVADKMIDGATKEAFEQAGSLLEAALQEKEKAIEDFRNLLVEIHKEVCIDGRGASSCLEKNIYIIIDEIDRCNPSYALKLLEEIKHLFSINGYIFIVMSNNQQLNNMASNIYGDNVFGAEGYINKFFDLKLSLKQPEKTKFIRMSLEKSEFIGMGVKNYIYVFEHIVKNSKISLRQIVDAVNMYKLLKIDNGFLFFLLLCLNYNFEIFYSREFEYFVKEFKIDNDSLLAKKNDISFLRNALELRSYVGDPSIGNLKNKLQGEDYARLIDSYQDYVLRGDYNHNLDHLFNMANLIFKGY